MPIYDYRCESCGEHREVLMDKPEERAIMCLCGAWMKKIISRPGLLRPDGASHPNSPDEVERRRKEPEYRKSKIQPTKRR